MLKNDALVCLGPSGDPTPVGTVRPKMWAESNGIEVPEGMFAVESPAGVRYLGELGYGTQRRFGLDCPVVHLYYVTTEARDGSVWGVKGGRVSVGQSRHYTRPENVLDSGADSL